MEVIRGGGAPDQTGGGTAWRGRGGPWRRRLGAYPTSSASNSAALAGHARLFIHPAYARLVNSEPYVKRLIPILIVLFVVALGGMRVRRALSGARRERRRAPSCGCRWSRRRSSASSRNRPRPLSLAEPSEMLQGQLENALPPLADRSRPPDSGHGPAGHGRRRGARASPTGSAATSTRFSGRASR